MDYRSSQFHYFRAFSRGEAVAKCAVRSANFGLVVTDLHQNANVGANSVSSLFQISFYESTRFLVAKSAMSTDATNFCGSPSDEGEH